MTNVKNDKGLAQGAETANAPEIVTTVNDSAFSDRVIEAKIVTLLGEFGETKEIVSLKYGEFKKVLFSPIEGDSILINVQLQDSVPEGFVEVKVNECIAGKTGYVDDKGQPQTHTQDHYQLRSFFKVSEMKVNLEFMRIRREQIKRVYSDVSKDVISASENPAVVNALSVLGGKLMEEVNKIR
jgi:hypothetical protein